MTDRLLFFFFFFFNDTATTEIYTLSLHDALPIYGAQGHDGHRRDRGIACEHVDDRPGKRSEEHTSELQSQSNLVCRLLLEKKKKKHERLLRVAHYQPRHTQRRHLQCLSHLPSGPL